MSSSWFRPTLRLTEFELLIPTALLAVLGSLMIFLAPTGQVEWAWSDIWVSLALAAGMFAMSLSFGLRGFRGDQVILPVTATLATIGTLMIQRLHPDLAAMSDGYATLAQRQILYFAIGLGALWAVVMLADRLRLVDTMRNFKYLLLLVSLGLQLVTFIVGTGPPGSGVKLWISLGPIQIQPSEIVKITLVIFLAGYLDDKRELIGGNWRAGRITLPPIPYLVPMGLMGVGAVGILAALKDLGAALLFFAVFMTMLYVASGRPLYVSFGTAIFVLACFAAWRAFDRVGIRVQNWLDPWQDPYVAGYQPVQSEYAMASGGILGTGLAQGTPWRIPAVETDYIFSAIGEELGLLGTLAVLSLVLMLTIRGYLVAMRAQDGFVQLLAVGLTSIIAFQTIIIVGGVIRIIPLTGVTLPFVSYGGSSLVSNLALIGLLLHLSSLPRRM